jgi:hypothetical protein
VSVRQGVRGLALLATCAVVASSAGAADDRALYLGFDETLGRVLRPLAPVGTNVREDAVTASMGATVTFGPFATEPAVAAGRLGSGPVDFALFLGTGAAGMPGCADVAVTLTKLPASGGPAPLGCRRPSVAPRGSRQLSRRREPRSDGRRRRRHRRSVRPLSRACGSDAGRRRRRRRR